MDKESAPSTFGFGLEGGSNVDPGFMHAALVELGAPSLFGRPLGCGSKIERMACLVRNLRSISWCFTSDPDRNGGVSRQGPPSWRVVLKKIKGNRLRVPQASETSKLGSTPGRGIAVWYVFDLRVPSLRPNVLLGRKSLVEKPTWLNSRTKTQALLEGAFCVLPQSSTKSAVEPFAEEHHVPHPDRPIWEVRTAPG